MASAAQRSALALLQPLEASGVGDFAALALASLRADGGGGPKAHAAAARRLGCTGAEVEAAVAALAALFISAARAATPPPLLAQRAAAALGFAAGPAAAEALRSAYEAALPELRAALAAGAPPLGDAFTDLRWRLDVRVRPACDCCRRAYVAQRSACMAFQAAAARRARRCWSVTWRRCGASQPQPTPHSGPPTGRTRAGCDDSSSSSHAQRTPPCT